jgi:WD40 repeat protein
MLASGSQDGNVKLWDSATGGSVETLQGAALVSGYAYAMDGQIVSIPSAEQTMRLWKATGSPDGPPGYSSSQNARFLATDGRMLAITDAQKTLSLWDLAAQKERLTFEGHTDTITSAAFSPDGRLLATGSSDQTVKLWNAARPASGGRPSSESPPLFTLRGHTGPVYYLAFTHDGKLLLSGGDNGKVFMVWEVASGKKLGDWRLPGVVREVVITPDGRHVATANADGTVYILRLSSAPVHTNPKC